MSKPLLQKLIQTESVAAVGELGAAQVLYDYLTPLGIDCHIDTWDENRANFVAHLRAQEATGPALLFLCHLDVVPPGDASWQHPPFSGLDLDGVIYGRGATDMKGGTAAAVLALAKVVKSAAPLHGDIILAATAGEETDSCGVKRFVENAGGLPELAGVVIPEPTDFVVINAHRGLLWLEILTRGKTAHGSAPHLGVNAIGFMKSVLDALEDFRVSAPTHPRLGDCSISLNTIQGGKALNVVPDQCRLGLDIRTLPGQSQQAIMTSLEAILTDLRRQDPPFDASVSVIRSVDALETDPNNAFVRRFCDTVGAKETQAVGFTTDAPFVTSLGAPVLIFGPGKGEMCHQPDECIAWADVERAVDHYRHVMLDVCG